MASEHRSISIVIVAIGTMLLVAAGLAFVAVRPWGGLVLLGLTALLLFVAVMKQQQIDNWTIGIQLCAFVLYATYFSYTSYIERSPDAVAHLTYVNYLVGHHAFPPVSACIVCYHPPLYYGLAAVLAKWCEASLVIPAPVGLQLFSILLSACSLGAATLSIREFTRRPALLRFGTALIGFWPSTVMGSCRIHNDSLATLLVVTGGYWLFRWYRRQEARALWWASVFACLGVWTKASASVLIVATVCLLLVHLARTRMSRDWLSLVAPLLILAIGLVGTTWMHSDVRHRTGCERLFGRACEVSIASLPNDPPAFSHFDVASFVTKPYLVVTATNTEPAVFWNCLLKSSLFGVQNGQADTEMDSPLHRRIAIGMNVALLSMLFYVLITLPFMGWAWVEPRLPVFVCLLSAVALAMVFRAIAPNPHHSDFRHIQAALVWGGIALLGCIESHVANRRVLAIGGCILVAVMVGGSCAYFVPSASKTRFAETLAVWLPLV